MTSAAAASPLQELVLRSAVDVCSFVDELPFDAVGEIVFAERGGGREGPMGAVFVEGGRICWAAARGLARRLSDLLAASARLDAAAMESLYGHCKRQRTPLGEHLVSAGLVTAEGFRAALLRHTAESLHALCEANLGAQWVVRRRNGYSPRFTFTTPELLSHTFAKSHQALAAHAAAELADAFADRGWGAAFLRSATRAAPDPIAVHGASPDRIHPLLRLGRWATSTLDVTSVLDEHTEFVATVLDDGALVAWRSDATVIAGWTNVHGPARLLNRRARARRKGASHGGV